ncbi:MAG TPA: enoyl-CoA hydratase-related protein [Pyrinomonadaceae bacterium]|nr:enoyl-CoA hydratase-related protein [Pyrinomonadaceae bacterium]
MKLEAIIVKRRDRIVTVTINRPDKLNALSRETIAALSDAFQTFKNDNELRAIILTGAGERAFSAGTDLSELIDVPSEQALPVAQRGQKLCEQIEQSSVPVIAAVNGIAAGGGCELALACHLRVASEQARFSLPETKLGIIPGYGGTQRLLRELGRARSLELILTSGSIDAAAAMNLGLVNQVVQASELLATAESLAAQIAELAPLAIRACLRAVVDGSQLPLEQGLALEAKLFSSLFATEDMREGTRAFLEKRKPNFRGC